MLLEKKKKSSNCNGLEKITFPDVDWKIFRLHYFCGQKLVELFTKAAVIHNAVLDLIVTNQLL